MNIATIFDARGERCNAWAKAPHDVAVILQKEYGAKVLAVPHRRYSVSGRLWERVWYRLEWDFIRLKLLFKWPRRSFVLLQGHFLYMYQMLGYGFMAFLMRLKKCEYAFLVHDMPGHMIGDDFAGTRLPEGFVRMASRSRGIIVHNAKMAGWFAKGLDGRGVKIVNLECFDYLCGGGLQSGTGDAGADKIVYAGNLSSEKSPFLDKLGEVEGVRFELFGAPARESAGNVVYKGSRKPDDLPGELGEGFGLVWDGDSVETCSGPSGMYLSYNHPHKLSLYLASGMPVVIWRGAAQAGFVEKHGAGIAVESLKELPARLAAISGEERMRLRRNARALGGLLRAGHFTKKAVAQVLEGARYA